MMPLEKCLKMDFMPVVCVLMLRQQCRKITFVIYHFNKKRFKIINPLLTTSAI